jgi:excisionase family DNA binding protein
VFPRLSKDLFMLALKVTGLRGFFARSISKTLLCDRWRKEGMPFIKMGRGVRFDQDAVMKWIKDNKQN